MKSFELDVLVTRGEIVESKHRVHAAVVDERGALIGVARDPSYVTPWRSCAKPFQVMPFLESGGFDKLGWGDDQLALACASHGGVNAVPRFDDGATRDDDVKLDRLHRGRRENRRGCHGGKIIGCGR